MELQGVTFVHVCLPTFSRGFFIMILVRCRTEARRQCSSFDATSQKSIRDAANFEFVMSCIVSAFDSEKPNNVPLSIAAHLITCNTTAGSEMLHHF